MALTFYVEDQTHARVREFPDDSENTFLNVCRRAAVAGSRVMDIIDPYTDAMLNFIQLDRLIVELEELIATAQLTLQEQRSVEAVLSAAGEARGISGYLFIEGD